MWIVSYWSLIVSDLLCLRPKSGRGLTCHSPTGIEPIEPHILANQIAAVSQYPTPWLSGKICDHPYRATFWNLAVKLVLRYVIAFNYGQLSSRQSCTWTSKNLKARPRISLLWRCIRLWPEFVAKSNDIVLLIQRTAALTTVLSLPAFQSFWLFFKAPAFMWNIIKHCGGAV